jgi:hypothetical protein
MTHKIYTGTLTDAHGRNFMPFWLIDDDELEEMTAAGIFPDDLRPVTSMQETADSIEASLRARYEIGRMMDGVSA